MYPSVLEEIVSFCERGKKEGCMRESKGIAIDDNITPAIERKPGESGAKAQEEIITEKSKENISFIYCDVGGSSGNEELQLAAVMEIANALSSKIDLNELLFTISKELSKVIDYDIGCVAIYEKERNGLFLRHVWRKNGDAEGEGRYVPLEESNVIGWVAIHRKPMLRNNIPSDSLFSEIMREEKLKSDIVVPLFVKDNLIGTVNIGSYRLNNFTDFDLDLVIRFSKLTSIAIEKCQLIRELSDLAEKYNILMCNASEIIAMLDAQGRFAEVNKAMCDISGYGAHELIGKEFFVLIPPERREEARKTFFRMLRGELSKHSAMPYIRKDGQSVFVELSTSPVRVKGDPYMIVMAHDISDRKILEKQITERNMELSEANRRLRELDDLKNEFLGRISHELRTPLSVIMAYTGTLLEDHDQTIDPNTRYEFLKIISDHTNKLLGLINDLLDLSRVESSSTMLHMSEGSINDIVKISVRMVEPAATKKGVSIRTELDERIPIINFDSLRIRQACVYLLDNAVKFSSEGSIVTVRTRRCESELIVSVEDRGVGIAAEELPYLFESFTQLDGGTSREREGLGIGLKLVKHYVELHGGRVWAESEAGKGSIFSFSLPMQPIDEIDTIVKAR